MPALSRYGPLAALAVGGLLLAIAVLAQSGGTYDAAWGSIDGGGGTAAGGNYRVSGVIGQPEAGALAGGDFRLDGGVMGALYPPPVIPTPTPMPTPADGEKSYVPNAAKD